MVKLRQHNPGQTTTAGSALHLRPHPLAAALAITLALFSTAAARQDNACAAPGDLETRAEILSKQWKEASLREALGEFEGARGCWSRAGLKREEAGALRRIGDTHFSLSEYTQAVEAYEEALARSREVGDRQAEARALIGLSRSMLFTLPLDKDLRKVQEEEAIQDAQEAASIAQTLADYGLAASAENVIGKNHYFRGEYDEATKHYEQALALARVAGDLAEQAQALYNAGQVHGENGELQEAAVSYQLALPLWQAAHQPQGEATTLNSLSLIRMMMGDNQEALECLNGTVLPFMREAGNRKGEAQARINIGSIYQSLGDYETALSYYRDALEIYEQINYATGQASAWFSIGDAYALLGSAVEAQRSYEHILPLASNNPPQRADALNCIASVLLADGKNDEAYKLSQEALSVFEERKIQIGQAAAHSNIGRYFGGRGDWRAARDHFRQAREIYRTSADEIDESLALYNIARSDLEIGDAASARTNVEDGLRIAESLHKKIADGDMQASYFASAHCLFELHIAVLMKLYEHDHDPALVAAAFEASERGRARSLLETLGEAGADIRQGVDPELLSKEHDKQLELDAEAELRVRLLGDGATANQLAEVEQRIKGLIKDYHLARARVRAAGLLHAAFMPPAPITLAETQQKVLDADTVLLEYSLGEERSFVWAVTPDSIRSFELPARADVEKTALRVYELLIARNRRVKGETGQQWQARISRAEAEYDEASAALSRMVLGPVAAELGHKRLVIIGDGALQYVPFAALPAPSGAATEKGRPESATTRRTDESSSTAASQSKAAFTPLIAEHEVVSLPSASVLALIRQETRGRRPAPKTVAILADPVFDGDDERLASAKDARAPRLDGGSSHTGEASEVRVAGVAPQRGLSDFGGPGEGPGIGRLIFSQREARAIMASVPSGDGLLALSFRASRDTARSPELSQYRILHFATHGLLNSKHPELSGVVLSLFDETGRRQDGFLKLDEIYNLNLPADLVVLSACQTALGKDVRGEGMVSLTRGFMHAGAQRVVASLWEVDDAATAELMGDFYREMLSKGLRPAEALRAAQIHISQQPRWHSPYFWAAFTLQGEWR